MIDLILKWTFLALVLLIAFSAITIIYGLYGQYLSGCNGTCEKAHSYRAFLYIGIVGLSGFGCSAFAAYIIRKRLSN
ncbi:hypothetical protein RYZ27_09735 [Hyphomonas sp. FCG-A18]|uniref:hypothetical protein n=1 Tax=Hyphomonas sp. FCG-A18 TaxID=3080019 RepID=UPI002B29C854|nr:hypothetical protein RYZ27_09735 [Hyphomonas sp. FCG-A18]